MPSDITTRAPTRIDLGGGWTDVPPYSDELGGFVCNIAIDRYATVTLNRDDERPDGLTPETHGGYAGDRSIAAAAARRFRMSNARLVVHSDFPIGAGLGGSSAVGVAAVAALATASAKVMTPSQMAELSREIEISDLGIPGGRQDHYAAAYGGALGLRFGAGDVDVRQIPLSPSLKAEIERRCTIVYTGQSRISGETITAVIDAYRNGERRVLQALESTRRLAEQMADALTAEDLDTVAALVGEQWTHQRSLHPAIPTPRIDEVIACGAKAGALGSKALGASGGGCVLVIAHHERCDQVRDAVSKLGEVLPFKIDLGGVEQCT